MSDTCKETLDMIAATVGQTDQFAAGQLLGVVTVERVRQTGDETLISSTHRAMHVVSQPMRDQLIEGFSKAIYFNFCVDRFGYVGGRLSNA